MQVNTTVYMYIKVVIQTDGNHEVFIAEAKD